MKKQLIFKEVLAMLNAGTEYKAITLAEVAKRCKMGKSTIYEYFTSKDEMIYNAIIFYINKMLKFFSSSFKISTFEPSLKIWIKAMMVCMKSNKWMLLPWTFKTYASYLDKDDAARAEDLLGKSQTIIIKLLTAICKKGVAEGYIVDYSDASVEYVYYGAIGTLAKYVGEDFDYSSEEGVWLVDTITAHLIKHLSTEALEVEELAQETEEDYADESEQESEEEYAEESQDETEYTEESQEDAEYAEDGEYADQSYANEEYAEEDYADQEYADSDAGYEDDESGYDSVDASQYEDGPEDIDY
jgi:AcrR family transcriptional regulator